jgi:SAM-dependent MidA family methyltransferase
MQPEHGTGLELPLPDTDSARHSSRVAQHIRSCIDTADGSISFAEFMQHALYAPGLGYYTAGTKKFGAGGDFVTAPEISPLFGNVLARQCAAVLEQLPGGNVLEPGAGSGALAVSLLNKLDQLNALPDQYMILEVSADLQQRQEQRLREEVPHLADRVTWLSELPRDFAGVIVANEVADALPFERVVKRQGVLQQFRVGVEKDDFVWQFADAPELLQQAFSRIEAHLDEPLADEYATEISPAVSNWIGDLSASLNAGMIFLFDYGVTRREYYAPDRHQGWLRCHFRHRVHNDPLILPGIQDLTAWVDFSAVAEAAQAAGLEVAGYVTQAHFLLHGGLDEELTEFTSLPQAEQLELSRQVKLLTLPGEMGESFKCIGLARGDIDLPGAFQMSDRTHML